MRGELSTRTLRTPFEVVAGMGGVATEEVGMEPLFDRVAAVQGRFLRRHLEDLASELDALGDRLIGFQSGCRDLLLLRENSWEGEWWTVVTFRGRNE